MDVRSQVSVVFHLDKCIGCHTCSLACKNIWTDRKGAEYMWWNNVETKPGTGFPTLWEDQDKFKGGWEVSGNELALKSTNGSRLITEIFHHPHHPTMDDYYEPWTYDFQHLFNGPEEADQPTARPISLVTGEHIEIESGPNWDDDFGGSPIYAENDPNFAGLPPEVKKQLFAIERVVFFYLPRICNHCLNPACVASCPSGAMYKRGEDGIVLVDQKSCRAWRNCVSACPYKKMFFNWKTGKSEKCILCFPRMETGQAPACFHSCVGRIRYVGVLLYDAERIVEVARSSKENLVDAQRSLILDPFDPKVIAAARANGIPEAVVTSAQKSPVYKFVKLWGIALPPHLEFRTLPSLFYVPPMGPVFANRDKGVLEHAKGAFFHDIEQARVPIQFLANLLSAGNESKVEYALRKQKAVRWYRRAVTVGDVPMEDALKMLAQADCTTAQADEIFRIVSNSGADERFEIPPFMREMAIEATEDPGEHKKEMGFGFLDRPKRGS